MTQWTPEQWIRVQMSGLETMAGLGSKVVVEIEKVVALNVQTAKTTLGHTREGVVKAMSAQTPQELVELQIESFCLATDSVSSYWRQRYDILTATQADFVRVAEVQYATVKDQLEGAFDCVGKGAASDSTPALAAWQVAVGTATALYESMQLVAKQALDVAGRSFSTGVEPATKSVRRRAA